MIVVVISVCLGSGHISTWIDWYGYKKWKYRVHTSTAEKSKFRGVFVKLLKYKVIGNFDSLGDFQPYLEKGFRYGYHSSDGTVPITESNYSFQLSYRFSRRDLYAIKVGNDAAVKFDSSDLVWGYLKDSTLKDTLTLTIEGPGKLPRKIKLWE